MNMKIWIRLSSKCITNKDRSPVVWMKKIISDLHTIIFAWTLAAAGISSYVFFESIRTAIDTALLASTPLWAAITLAITVIAYTYLKARSFQPPLEKRQIEFITIKDIKWKVTIDSNDRFIVEDTPYCAKHDMSFIKEVKRRCCPGPIGSPCDTFINDQDYSRFYTSVVSLVDNKVRNGYKLR